jgi:Caspase domain
MTIGISIPFTRLRSSVLLVSMLLMLNIATYAQELEDKTKTTIDLRALIIGVAHTPQIKDLPSLEGVASDVRAMRKLVLQLGVQPSKLTVLSDTEPNSEAPTLSNILQALYKLEQSTTASTHVLIYLSGHGAQQPIQTNAKAAGNEFDGLDEIFLTADAQPFGTTDRTTPGALTDNMLAEILDRLVRKGTHVWLIVDSCNAGTMTRGAKTNDTDANAFTIVGRRGASLSAIGVPSSISWQSLSTRGKRLKGQLSTLFPTAEKTQTFASQWPNVTAFYATGEAGEAVDVRLNSVPASAKPSEVRGLFTYLLTTEANRLLDTTGKSSVISYRLLMQRVLARYRQHAPKSAPLPTFEGVSNTSWFGRSSFQQ